MYVREQWSPRMSGPVPHATRGKEESTFYGLSSHKRHFISCTSLIRHDSTSHSCLHPALFVLQTIVGHVHITSLYMYYASNHCSYRFLLRAFVLTLLYIPLLLQAPQTLLPPVPPGSLSHSYGGLRREGFLLTQRRQTHR